MATELLADKKTVVPLLVFLKDIEVGNKKDVVNKKI